MKIVETTNCFIEEIEKAHKEGKSLYFLGGGITAKAIYNKVFKGDGRDIPLEAVVLDDDYYNASESKEMCGVPIIPMSQLDVDNPNVFLCVAYMYYDSHSEDPVLPEGFKGILFNQDVTFVFDKTDNEEYLDYDFYTSHIEEFERTYSMLADEKSRKVMELFVNQRISGRFIDTTLRDTNQYFDKDIVDISKIKCFVDCGAYTGDSYEAFLENYRMVTGNEYKDKAYLWEPDDKNYDAIMCKHKQTDNVTVIKKGVWSEHKELSFQGGGLGGYIKEEHGMARSITVDSIDNIIREKVDFIKMDVEGSEYNALLGAERMIRENHPILAICMYHKRGDLLEIPKLLRNFNPEYKFYLRMYSEKYTTELVLYAIPTDK